MLPVIAVLHVRHLTVRDSGAMLGTISGVAVVVARASGASAAPELALAALFVRAIWWWTDRQAVVGAGRLPALASAPSRSVSRSAQFALVLALGPTTAPT